MASRNKNEANKITTLCYQASVAVVKKSMIRSRSIVRSYLLTAGVLICLSPEVALAQQTGLTLDANGSIVLVSKDGRRTALAEQSHCNEISGIPDNRLMVCMVSRGADDQGFRPQFQIEIYHDDGSKFVLEPGGAIRDWHFWNDDQQIAVAFKASDGQVFDALYSTESGNLIERLAEPANLSELPQWAKSRAQINDESVPMDRDSEEMRNKWMDKVFRQIETIQPGMHRRDLETLFRMDGGINPIGGNERYVFKECSMIKIDVTFKTPGATNSPQPENPDAVIESVSKPYLQYPFAD